MSNTRTIESRITRDLLRRPRGGSPGAGRFAERLITAAAVAAGMLLLGSYLQELLWAVLAGAAVLTLGTRVAP